MYKKRKKIHKPNLFIHNFFVLLLCMVSYVAIFREKINKNKFINQFETVVKL